MKMLWKFLGHLKYKEDSIDEKGKKIKVDMSEIKISNIYVIDSFVEDAYLKVTFAEDVKPAGRQNLSKHWG